MTNTSMLQAKRERATPVKVLEQEKVHYHSTRNPPAVVSQEDQLRGDNAIRLVVFEHNYGLLSMPFSRHL